MPIPVSSSWGPRRVLPRVAKPARGHGREAALLQEGLPTEIGEAIVAFLEGLGAE